MVCLATVGITERRFKVPPSSLLLLLICGFYCYYSFPFYFSVLLLYFCLFFEGYNSMNTLFVFDYFPEISHSFVFTVYSLLYLIVLFYHSPLMTSCLTCLLVDSRESEC
ncbi:hypothetical protein ES288_D08G194700v1 [Gossypium darwinii]|uniref:Uncharacterized protein n=1 Tax=Gossypium darwinii TaxID=34276 RepID=A0A5D2BRA5_GOSDA|nr:hypothetical protein ES288_D08G194700v1 [Gossypium darwinii]